MGVKCMGIGVPLWESLEFLSAVDRQIDSKWAEFMLVTFWLFVCKICAAAQVHKRGLAV